MKRPPLRLHDIKEFPVKKVKPFFWTACAKCGNEYRRECMWRISFSYNSFKAKPPRRNRLTAGPAWYEQHFCLYCFPCKQDPHKYIENELVGNYQEYRREDIQ